MGGILRLALAAAAALAAACGGSGLKLQMIDASRQKPSNVAVYFTVDTADGEPVPGLTADKFKIYEDGQLVSPHESKQTILNPEVAAVHYAVLLIDMSGSVTESQDLPTIIAAASAFADRIGKSQQVAVYAFDGRPELTPVVSFTSDSGGLHSGIESLQGYTGRDPSTNLNGAVMNALDVLDQQVRRTRDTMGFGTLIVFTDGTDRAARVPRDEMEEAVAQSPHAVFVIGVGSEIDGDQLGAIGKNQTILSKDRREITSSFQKLADRLEAYTRRYYLLGYCSPARAGVHQVTIEANADGRGGSLAYEFDAAGFGPNCDPTRPPRFDIKRARGPVREQGDGDGASGRDGRW